MDKEKAAPIEKFEDSRQDDNSDSSDDEEYFEASGSSVPSTLPVLAPLTSVVPRQRQNAPGTSASFPPGVEPQPGPSGVATMPLSVNVPICRSAPGCSVPLPQEKSPGIFPMFGHFVDEYECDPDDMCGVETWSRSEHDLVAELIGTVSDYVRRVLDEGPSAEKERVLEELDRSSPVKDLVEDSLPELESEMRKLGIGGRKPPGASPVNQRYFRSASGRPLMVGPSPRRNLERTLDGGDSDDESEGEAAKALMKRAQQRAHAYAREDSEIERMKQRKLEIKAEIHTHGMRRRRAQQVEEVPISSRAATPVPSPRPSPRPSSSPVPSAARPSRAPTSPTSPSPTPLTQAQRQQNRIQKRASDSEESPFIKRYFENISNQFYHLWLNRYILDNNIQVTKELKLLRLHPNEVSEEEIEMGKRAMMQGMALIRDAHLGPRKPRPSQRANNETEAAAGPSAQPGGLVLPWEATRTMPDVARPSVNVPQRREVPVPSEPTEVAAAAAAAAPGPSQRIFSPFGAKQRRSRRSAERRSARSPSPRMVAPLDETLVGSRRSASADKRKRNNDAGQVVGVSSPPVAGDDTWDWSLLDAPEANPQSESAQRTLINLDTKEIVPASSEASSSSSPSQDQPAAGNEAKNLSVFVDTTPLEELPDPRNMPLGRFFTDDKLVEFIHVTTRWIEIVRAGRQGQSGATPADESITVTRHENFLQALWKAVQLERGDQRVAEVKKLFEQNSFLKWAFGLRFTQLMERRNSNGQDKKKTTSL